MIKLVSRHERPLHIAERPRLAASIMMVVLDPIAFPQYCNYGGNNE
jgi:hypothetical protein